MAVLFSVHTGAKRCGSVHGVASRTGRGVYDPATDSCLIADAAAVRECLPHYWRKAFDRACLRGGFWYDQASEMRDGRHHGATPFLTLRDTRGVFLATVYAIPYEFTAKGPQQAEA